MPQLWIVLCCLIMIACDKKSPPAPPVVDTPSRPVTINGTERIGWDQPAADTVELAAISYAAYVDGTRAPLAGVSCASAAAGAGFPCSARMPALSPGQHTLELASLVNDGGVLESARSAPLQVTLVAQATSAAIAPRLRSGLMLTSAAVAGGLEAPADLAFAPDGRVYIAERAGRIRVIRDGRLLGEPAISLADTLGDGVQLLALALDPQFERTRHAFAIYSAPSRSGEPRFTLARFRAVSDTLGDRAVLLDGVAASATPSAALRFGPDGKLYAALDDAGDARRRRDPASWNGKVLRLNADGTTPADAGGATPVYAEGFGSPVALDWDPATATLWVADRAAGATAFAFYRGALFPAWAGRLISADVLFEGAADAGVGLVAIAPDGAIVYGTARALGRLAPGRAP